MKKNDINVQQLFLFKSSKEKWVIRGLVVLAVLCALMWGLTSDLLKYERSISKQLRLKLQQEQGRMQQKI